MPSFRKSGSAEAIGFVLVIMEAIFIDDIAFAITVCTGPGPVYQLLWDAGH